MLLPNTLAALCVILSNRGASARLAWLTTHKTNDMRIKKRYVLPVLGALGIFMGPSPRFADFDGQIKAAALPLPEIDGWLAAREDTVALLKPDNHSRIVWADSVRKTPWAIVYLHGFSASPMEGDPIHRELAQRYGCNLYLPRLAGHGLDTEESFLELTPAELLQSAKEAIAIGRLLGDSVLVMGTSTGCTLATYLAAESPEWIDALMFYSPNFALANPAVELLTKPWGLYLGRAVQGGKYNRFTPPPGAEQYWTTAYRMEGVVCLQGLMDKTMNDEVFAGVRQPLFVGYYYKNEEEQDPVVSVAAIEHFCEVVGTPVAQFRKISFPEAGNHVITSSFHSKDLEGVRSESASFLEGVLGLRPVADVQ